MGRAVDWERAQQLAACAQRGDTLAMSDLLELLAPYVIGLCRAIAGPRSEDVAQEALIIIFRRLRSLRELPALRGWVRTVSTREALRALAKTPTTIALDDSAPQAAPQPAPELRPALAQALAGLPAEQRAALVLREIEGLSEKEIAGVLQVAPGTVKSRLYRARERFRTEWSR